MKTVTIHQAKTNLSKLIRDVLNGHEVIIARGKVPLVKLEKLTRKQAVRVFGAARGSVSIAKDFDAPLKDFSEYEGS
jgi:antitoxin (DNA-binding transcriptional repressor) of toxin-antitoxin stability system